MFQYAFGKTLAIKNNTDLVLSTAYLQSKLPFKKWSTQMRYELAIFNIHATIESNIFSGKLLYPIAKTEYLLRTKINEIQLNKIEESQFSFQSDLLNGKDNSFVKGNFQSEKYFKSIEPIIRQEFTFKRALSGKNAEWKDKIENCNAVSIHIRRGDYISIQANAKKFEQTSLSYYDSAIQCIANQLKNPVFFVFSDDTTWVKQHLKSDFPLHFIDNNNTADTSHLDMQLMSLCQHNIICNSTFSWWSAWLNINPQKIVIAPQKWFADVSINSQDIIPDEWIKL